MATGLSLGLVIVSFALQSVQAEGVVTHLDPDVHTTKVEGFDRPRRGIQANFLGKSTSSEVEQFVNWVLDSGDNQRMPFLIVDKKNAQVFVFAVNGRLTGSAPVLLGLAVGDDSVPGIGTRKLSSIGPKERTTPAGRFVATMDLNLAGNPILWVSYEEAVSLHPVITSNAKEQRAERLATLTSLDNRISYGCVNVSGEFFHQVITPAFTGTGGIVYVLPETKSVQAVFGSYHVEERSHLRSARLAQ